MENKYTVYSDNTKNKTVLYSGNDLEKAREIMRDNSGSFIQYEKPAIDEINEKRAAIVAPVSHEQKPAPKTPKNWTFYFDSKPETVAEAAPLNKAIN